MKMETVGKAEFVDSEVAPKTSEKQETASDEDGPIELERQTQKDNMHTAADSAVLSSMPCLLMELRRDSSESQLASTESNRPMGGRVYESDSSNHCMLSPSSSGHLADSDTLSSAEENEPCQDEAAVEGDPSAVSGAAVGRKSRRSRSESETSTMAAKKNRQSSDKQNGRATKVKGHRSQKHKERIRLLRQKREAAARKKYNLLQDSSTSDSDLTCDSSTSSSDDDEEASGSSKTITAEIPAGFSRAGGSGGVTREIPGLLDRGTVWDRNCIGNVLEEAMNCFAEMQRQTEEKFRMWIEKLTRLDTDKESKQQVEPREPKIQLVGQRTAPTTHAPTETTPNHLLAHFSLPLLYYGLEKRIGETKDGPPVIAHYDISDTNSDPEVVNVDNLLAAAVVQEHNNYLGNQDSGSTWRTRGLLDELSADTGVFGLGLEGSPQESLDAGWRSCDPLDLLKIRSNLDPGLLAGDKISLSNAQINEEINIASSDSEVEIVGVQEHARYVHPRGGVIQSVSSWKHDSGSQYINTQQTQSWTAVTPQQNWSSPPEVVDLTLDEDTRRKYLL
ncbi:hypothetical protein DUI87_02307 [Hirundo rustica rustica]|uniref:E3 ubiquitin-protein ligase Arkadia N-terminal domain-containing protein n=1 Tax=Hirundo rustica rustica TaxID=333673 RepID=A0A3M0L8J2_HIRRU|nr:hypothetical protein DUI87_02307 [Hirundo rustica rustica]